MGNAETRPRSKGKKATDLVSFLAVGFIRCSPFISHHVIETIPAGGFAWCCTCAVMNTVMHY